MMASSATECVATVGDLPTVHSTTSALSTGEIHLEDTLQGAQPTAFSNVMLEVADDGVKETKPKKKVPRRIIHFSDGIVEEYSTDEEDEVDKAPLVDPKSLTWMPWVWYYTVSASFRALSVVDFCGEKLAWLFGITSPKYQFAIDEYNRMVAEDKEDLEREEREKEAMRQRALQAISDMEGAAEVGSQLPPEPVSMAPEPQKF